jgi:hypothetical protein
MILEQKTLDLCDKMLFQKARIRPAVKRPLPMSNEACFLYILKGGEYSTIPNTPSKPPGTKARAGVGFFHPQQNLKWQEG